MAWVMTRHGARGTRYTGAYRDPDGRTRSAGSFSTRRDALRAANREEQKVLAGAWHDNAQGDITFRDYVEKEWLPNKHVEASTRAAYISYLDKHFYPFFGHRRLNKISPSLVQDWVTQAKADGLAPRSIRKYHVFLSSVFVRAVKDRVLVYNPCDHTELPKVIAAKARTLTPEEYERLLAALPAQHRLMVETLIEAGLRWGELVALKPRHIDFLRRTLAVEETIVEVSKKHSPTGQRYLPSPTPRTTNPALLASARPGSTRSPHTSRPTASGTTTCCSPPRREPRSRETPSAPGPGSPPSTPAGSTSRSGSTTCATPTPPGCSPAEPTSPPSWNAWATPRSRPPRNTSTPSPTPTNATSTL